MRWLLAFAVAALLLVGCHAQLQCDVSAYGAVGDGKTDNTVAIQKAIDDCATRSPSSQSVVLIPAGTAGGNTFLSASLFLRSNLKLLVGAGATLLGSANYTAYPMLYSRFAGTMGMGHASLLNGAVCQKMHPRARFDPASGELLEDAAIVGGDACQQWGKLSNVVVTGRGGTIDGQGSNWWPPHCNPLCPDGTDSNQRPTLLGLLWIDGLEVSGLALHNSAFWTLHPTFCNNVVISGLDIYAPANSHNTDGIDPDSTSNVHIWNCTIDTGDDCIAIKSGKNWSGRQMNISSENILVEQCLFRHGHGVAIGSETSGSVRNVTIRDSTLSGTQRGVRVKSARGRGGVVENVSYQYLQMLGVGVAVSIDMNYDKSPPTNKSATPVFRNFQFSNIQATGTTGEAGEYLCLPESPCTGITMTSVTVQSSAKQQCQNAFGSSQGCSPVPCLQTPPPPSAV